MRIFLKVWIPVTLSLIFISNIQAQNNPPELSGISCGTKYSSTVHAFETMKMVICSHDEDGDSLEFLRLRALNGQPDSLLWETENGLKIHPTATFEMSDTNSSTRPYNFEVCISDGVDTTCRIFRVRVLPRYIASTDQRELEKLKVYPNPANQVLNFQGIQNLDYYEIQNLAGQVMKRGNEPSPIEISGLKSGLYILIINSESQSYSVLFSKVN